MVRHSAYSAWCVFTIYKIQTYVNVSPRRKNRYARNIVVFVTDVYREATSMSLSFLRVYENETPHSHCPWVWNCGKLRPSNINTATLIPVCSGGK